MNILSSLLIVPFWWFFLLLFCQTHILKCYKPWKKVHILKIFSIHLCAGNSNDSPFSPIYTPHIGIWRKIVSQVLARSEQLMGFILALSVFQKFLSHCEYILQYHATLWILARQSNSFASRPLLLIHNCIAKQAIVKYLYIKIFLANAMVTCHINIYLEQESASDLIN